MQSFAVLAAFVVIVLAWPGLTLACECTSTVSTSPLTHRTPVSFSRKSGITSTYNGPWITQTVVEQVTRTEVSPQSTDVDCYYTGAWDTKTVVEPVAKTIASPADYTSSA
jgi:hypothetical protein